MSQNSFSRLSASLLAAASLSLVACGSSNDAAAPTSEPEAIQLISLSNFQAADIVIGQADFAGGDANQGGTTPDGNTIDIPYGNAGVHNGVLYLPDYGNHRLLGYNAIPAVNNAIADFVLGQVDFTSAVGAASATAFKGVQTVTFDQGKMLMTSYSNNRVLIWDSVPTSGGVPADRVVGQVDLDSAGLGCSATQLGGPEAIAAVAGKLIVTDVKNSRVLIWNTIPTSNGVAADIVLGQQNFDHCVSNDANADGAPDAAPTASTMRGPAGVWSDGKRLVVLDGGNNRVLIWSSFPTSNAAPADVVLGQSDFVHVKENDDDQDGSTDPQPTARTLNGPYDGVYSNGQQLFIADSYNDRILIWNTFPTANFMPADVVLGQSDFAHDTENDDNQDGTDDGSPSARTFNFPSGVLQVGNQLIVTDGGNSRYLIYNGQ